jgi:hypothetical protein
MSVIANTTVVSNFASINQLNLLRRLFGALYISTEVYDEIQSGLEEGYQFCTGIDQMIHPFVQDGWTAISANRTPPSTRMLSVSKAISLCVLFVSLVMMVCASLPAAVSTHRATAAAAKLARSLVICAGPVMMVSFPKDRLVTNID